MRRLGVVMASLSAWLLLLGAWWLVAAGKQHPGTLWATPAQVAQSLWVLRGAYAANAGATLEEAALGFALAVTFAVIISLAGRRRPPVEGTLHNLAIALYSLPLIAIAPMLVLWTGSGMMTKVVIAALASFFPVLIGLTHALRSTNPGALELMQLGAASSWQRFRRVELPYALPALFASFTIAAPAAILGAMLAEWTGANQGLGIQMLNSMQQFSVPEFYATLAVASALSLLAWLMFIVVVRLLFPWQASVASGPSRKGT
jgi:ABC-type nitrate/sulfonate/bicarbonate transport system permease component